jgi:hypothetical protein
MARQRTTRDKLDVTLVVLTLGLVGGGLVGYLNAQSASPPTTCTPPCQAPEQCVSGVCTTYPTPFA